MTALHIEITDEEMAYVEEMAREQGFATPEAYVKSLLLEPGKAELLDDIRHGLLAAERGDPMPSLDEMWGALDDDETAR
jgi:hypothetical protein